MRHLIKESRIISSMTWKDFLGIVRYISENEQAQHAIEGDAKFATQLRNIIKKLQDDLK